MTNPVGIHALVWVGDTDPASVDTAISQTVAAGYDLLEFSLHDSVNLNREKARELLTTNGLQAACSRGLARDADISSEDPAVVARGAALLHESLRVTHDIGATLLTGALYSAFGKAPYPLTATGRDNVVGVLRELAAEAAPLGVTLGLEICNRYETNVINTTQETLDFIAAVDRPNVMAHLDTYHMNIEESSFREPVLAAASAGRLGYVHVGESHRGQLGTGSVPWDEFFAALAEVGYSGTVTFESFSSEVVHPTLSSNLSIWRDLWSDGTELATGARRFLRENLGS